MHQMSYRDDMVHRTGYNSMEVDLFRRNQEQNNKGFKDKNKFPRGC